MRFKLLVVGVLAAVAGSAACSDDDSNNTGAAGSGGAGTTGAAGTDGGAGTTAASFEDGGQAGTGGAGTGGAGSAGTGAAGTGAQAFVAVDPCPTEASFVMATSISVPPDAATIGYTPKCLKVAAGTTVTIGANQFHPLSGTTAGSAGNPIPMHQTTPQTVTFPTPGFFSFQCDVHFALGMKGVVWVTP